MRLKDPRRNLYLSGWAGNRLPDNIDVGRKRVSEAVDKKVELITLLTRLWQGQDEGVGDEREDHGLPAGQVLRGQKEANKSEKGRR